MTIPTKTLTNEFVMPVYGLGTWGIGGTHEPTPQTEASDIAAIQTAIDNGITHLDTAEIYAQGHSETILGKAMKKYARKNLFLVSKVYLDHLDYDDLIKACRDSLKRLQTEYLDLYLTHRFSLEIPIEETMKAMNTLVEEGLVKQIGVSNYNAEEMAQAQAVSKHKIVANQVHYNLRIREAEDKGVLKYCQDNDMMLIAWRPLQKGLLAEGSSALIETLCKKYHKTPTQIALNWLISQKNVVTLSKTTSAEHLKENLGAFGWKMEEEDIEKLRSDFPNKQYISDSVPLH
jgi:diketogulonate reductase-like aldo/keto reductase